MNKSTGYVLVVLIFALLISYLAVNFYFKEDARVIKWEYRIVSLEDLQFQESMEALGNAGWELAFARRAVSGEGYSSKGVYECIFKKPKLEK